MENEKRAQKKKKGEEVKDKDNSLMWRYHVVLDSECQVLVLTRKTKKRQNL